MTPKLNAHAAPFIAVLAHFLGAFLFAILASFLMGWADFEAILSLNMAAFLHAFIAGFVMLITAGALLQMSSVILEKAFFGVKMWPLWLIFLVSGLFIMSFGLFNANSVATLIGGSLLFLGAILFAVCFLFSFKGIKLDSFAKTALFLAAIFLNAGLVCGVILAINMFLWGFGDVLIFLWLHLYFILGAIFFVILGAGAVLIAMFGLISKPNLILFKLAAILYLFSPVATELAIMAFLLTAIGWIMMLKNRAKKQLDIWAKSLYLAAFGVVLAAIIYPFNISVATLIMLNALLAFIAAHLYKIAPFLIWFHFISPFVGRYKVPMLNEMISPKLANSAIVLNLFSLILAAALIMDLKLQFIAQIAFLAAVLALFSALIKICKYIRFEKYARKNL